MITIPMTARSTPDQALMGILSLNKITDSTEITSGVVLVIIPPSTAGVHLRPISRQMLNKKIPVSDCKSKRRSSLPVTLGMPSIIRRIKIRSTDASPNLNREARNTGNISVTHLPTTMELPTVNMATAIAMYALKLPLILVPTPR
ncbi:hypothetical protein D3C73_366290 [compost metagenome]